MKVISFLWRSIMVMAFLAVIFALLSLSCWFLGAPQPATIIKGWLDSKPAATVTTQTPVQSSQPQVVYKTDTSAVKAAEAKAAEAQKAAEAAQKAAEEAAKKANQSDADKKAAEEAQKKAEEAQKKAEEEKKRLEEEKKAAEEAAKKSSPSISSLSEKSISDNTVVIRAKVFAGGSNASVWVRYGTSRSNLTGWTGTQTVVANATDFKEIGISGLSVNTKYYYMVVVENNSASAESEILSFTTSSNQEDDPEIVSVDEKDLSHNSITIKVKVNSGSEKTKVWVEYGTSSGSFPSSTSKTTVSANDTETVYIGLTGLSASTRYYYRVIAESDTGSDYYGQDEFVTNSSSTGGSQTAHVVTLSNIATWQYVDSDTNVRLTLGSLGTQPANRRVWIEQAVSATSPTSTVYCIGTTSSYDTLPTFPKSAGLYFKLHIEGVSGETGMTDVSHVGLSDYTFTTTTWWLAQ